MQVSPDGTVPNIDGQVAAAGADRKRQPQTRSTPESKGNRGLKNQSDQDDSLYSEFEQMLLEEDDA